MRRIVWALAGLLAAAPSLFATGVRDAFTVKLQEGWNAFFLPVTPDVTADEFFADWPTDAVGFYDQAAFLRTKQFAQSTDDSTLGAVDNGMKMWFRNEPGKSSFTRLVANGVYVLQSTNAEGFVRTVYGVPEPTRVSWHVASGTNAPLNFVGISTDGEEATLTERGYFQGVDTGWTVSEGVIRNLWGFDTVPSLDVFYGEPKMGHGGVVAMDAAKPSDWSGVFFVSPYGGLDFSTNACQGVVTVRNDAGTNRTVRVSFRSGAYSSVYLRPVTPIVLAREEGVTGAWIENLAATPFERELAAGETLRLVLAVDRTQGSLFEAAAGTEFGGLVEVTDVSAVNPSHFRTALALSVVSDGKAAAAAKWPKGLWLAEVALDKVSQMVPDEQVFDYVYEVVTNYNTYTWRTNVLDAAGEPTGVVLTNDEVVATVSTNAIPISMTEPVKAGSTMRVRILVHVDALGTMTLLQRARIGSRRISSLAVDTEGASPVGSGTFGTDAQFDWTIGEKSKVNPFRHARHPDHDGLTADFRKPTPSGDDYANYMSTVKPELFTVRNRLRLEWNVSGATAWNPDETLSGSATWVLIGLRHEGGIKATGAFSMRRLAVADLADVVEKLN